MVSDRQSLTKDVSALIEDPENLKYLSIVSLQELITAFRTKNYCRIYGGLRQK